MDFAEVIRRQREFFQTRATRPVEFRRGQLHKISAALEAHETKLLAALEKDLGKSPFQGYATELGLLHAEIRHAQNNLPHWAKPRRKNTPWLVAPARGWVQPEPFGVALIFSPWNYPLQLLLAPLVSAIAAGNCAVLKPSELAPHTAVAVTEMLRETFSENFICAVNGGAEVAEALLREKFDKIFFTGSTRVGKLVMAAAAKNLTPVTLELGGKCPVIVCADANVELAARRIAWGKFMNAGQTCVAPDFVLVESAVHGKLMAALKKSIQEFYGEDASKSGDYGRIVNANHFERLANYLRDGKVIFGGNHNAQNLFFPPTILTDVPLDSPVIQEEIFGPILPTLPFENLDDAIRLLQNRPTPLALYLFTADATIEAKILSAVRSGGACINDVVSHMIGSGLPFGGLGESGLGAYHGRAGFDAFSHHRAILRRATWLDLPFRYPPQNISLVGVKRALRFLLRG